MKIEQIEVTSSGKYRRKNKKGNGWNYYEKKKCSECGDDIFVCQAGLKHKNYYCKGKSCQYKHMQKQKDPLAANILDNINTPNFCYLIGLIVTDGHISWPGCYNTGQEGWMISIELHKKDLHILQNIQELFGGKIYKTSPTLNVWTSRGRHFVEYLRDTVGISHNKTFNLNVNKWFYNLTDDNKKHFIRGVIDGDGSINKNCTSFNICSASEDFIKLLSDYFNGLDIYKETKNRNNPLYYIKACLRTGSYNLLKPIYSVDKDILYFKRKYNQYKILEEKNKNYSKGSTVAPSG